jgi:hypothetical protein
MKWWNLPLFVSAIYLVIVVGAGLVHLKVISPTTLPASQQDALLHFYFAGAVIGVLTIWLVYVTRHVTGHDPAP